MVLGNDNLFLPTIGLSAGSTWNSLIGPPPLLGAAAGPHLGRNNYQPYQLYNCNIPFCIIKVLNLIILNLIILNDILLLLLLFDITK